MEEKFCLFRFHRASEKAADLHALVAFGTVLDGGSEERFKLFPVLRVAVERRYAGRDDIQRPQVWLKVELQG